MYRRNVSQTLVLVLGLLFAFGILPCFAKQQSQEESFTITTYYPSPYGSYNELQTNRLAIGDTDGDGQLDDGDQPNRDGDIRLKPQSGKPSSWPTGEEGQLAYSQTDDAFYHSNGSEWVAQGGGTAVMYLSCAWGTDYTAGVNHGWDGSCTPPSCPSGWTSTGTFSEPLSVACPGLSTYNGCYWGGTNGNYHPVAVGRSVRVCVK